MIHSDDMPDDTTDLVWIVQTTLWLVPRKVPFDPMLLSNNAVDGQALSTMAVGMAETCEVCGYVGIQTRGFVWGEERFGKDLHCPYCTNPPEREP